MFILLWFVVGVLFVGLVLGFLLSLGVGNLLSGKIFKNYLPVSELESIVESKQGKSEKDKPEATEKKYFMKLGANKVPIDASEVKDAKQKGYEILIE